MAFLYNSFVQTHYPENTEEHKHNSLQKNIIFVIDYAQTNLKNVYIKEN